MTSQTPNSPDSSALNLREQKISNGASVLDVTTLPSDARTRIARWPQIAVGQKLWLSYAGTNADDTPYAAQTYDATPVPIEGLPGGMYPNAPVAQLRGLKDGSTLRIEFKVTFDGSTDESTAVLFPIRIYTVKALVALKPEITSVKDSKGVEIPDGHTTVDSTVKLAGTATANTKVEILDGTTSKGQVDVDGNGIWTRDVTGLAVTSHSFTARGLYASNPVSTVRRVVVLAALTPAINSVKDSKGVEIPDGHTTVDTTVKLAGTATANTKVEILDGTTSKGQADVDGNGMWTRDVTGLAVTSHSFTAKGLYASNPVSTVRRVVVAHPLAISQSQMNLKGFKLIQNYGWATPGEVIGNTETRVPTGGVPPYIFTPENSTFASVSTDGKVTGLKNGSTNIIVSDASKNRVSYQVVVSNVYRLITSSSAMTPAEANTWALNQGGRAVRMDGLALNYNFSVLAQMFPTEGASGGRWHVPYEGVPPGVRFYWRRYADEVVATGYPISDLPTNRQFAFTLVPV